MLATLSIRDFVLIEKLDLDFAHGGGLGALTGEGGIAGADVGKIQISEQYSYVAVKRQVASAALKRLQEGKIKGRSYRARKLG